MPLTDVDDILEKHYYTSTGSELDSDFSAYQHPRQDGEFGNFDILQHQDTLEKTKSLMPIMNDDNPAPGMEKFQNDQISHFDNSRPPRKKKHTLVAQILEMIPEYLIEKTK